MKVAFFSTKPYDRPFFEELNRPHGHDLEFLDSRLDEHTVPLANGFAAICAFVNDSVNERVLSQLRDYGTRLVALRCAGFNNVDLAAAKKLGIRVVRVPAYSPHAVAEHAVGLMLALNRKYHRAYARVREGNFSLNGLLGFDMEGKVAGIVGTGAIGAKVARILTGFGCKIQAYDPMPNPDCEKLGVKYLSLEDLLRCSDIISLHCPLIPQTHHMINTKTLATMRDKVMLINTSRGALIDTRAVIQSLKSQKIGYLGLDVYEEEEKLFFNDLSDEVLTDDVFARLLTFPNVLVTGHQAFFTENALRQIAGTTLDNITAFENQRLSGNEIEFKE